MKTALTQFFEFVDKEEYNNYYELYKKYQDLLEVEKKQIINAYYACYADEIEEGEDAMFYGKQHYRNKYENNDSTTES